MIIITGIKISTNKISTNYHKPLEYFNAIAHLRLLAQLNDANTYLLSATIFTAKKNGTKSSVLFYHINIFTMLLSLSKAYPSEY